MANIAIVLADDFEDSEFLEPVRALEQAGHTLTVVGVKEGDQVTGKRDHTKVTIDQGASDVRHEEFDALVIPGGYSPDHLRTEAPVVAFVRGFHEAGKLIAAVCHGPSLLVDADAVRGHTLTSWPSIRRDLTNAGGDVVDEEVVVDGNLITSRKPDDLDAFCKAVNERLAA